jgi:hypothetical protein
LHERRAQIGLVPWRACSFLKGDITRFAVKKADCDIESFTHVTGQETECFFALSDHTE